MLTTPTRVGVCSLDAPAFNGYTAMQAACHQHSRAPRKAEALINSAKVLGLEMRSLFGGECPPHVESPLHLACQLPYREKGAKTGREHKEWPNSFYHVRQQHRKEKRTFLL